MMLIDLSIIFALILPFDLGLTMKKFLVHRPQTNR